MKEKIISVSFDVVPLVKIRVIENNDSEEIIRSKKKFPFELDNSLQVSVKTSLRNFKFSIFTKG